MIRAARRDPGQRDATTRIKAWTRARFALAENDTVFVSEVACGLPGCPPIETVVAFWTAPETRHAYKVFKPLASVEETDLPPAFMKTALIVGPDDFGCC
ncbi:hypothetical protein HDIA_4231 [Hartmannibacter diazotrophicus]|uniref:Uncharacterized protein n=1 Tax=Hartmannibacter diazotrophicus TaxID=1482074 RepID=A0A2C9DBR1_9HYPH|nr:hypothetical protein [Hartmannibacter diazotrophicus]SON57772.1 hypothetical protein HDIA_4231 [Hartmannibacter diazotrophicus]